MIEDENKNNDGLLTCPSCGERSPKRYKRCPNCGAVLRSDRSADPAQNVAPTPTPPTQPAADPFARSYEQKNADVGTAFEEKRAVSEAKIDDGSYERTYGGTPFDERGVTTSRSGDDSYDRTYGGTPFDERSGAFSTTRSSGVSAFDEPQVIDDATKKKRKISFIAYLVSVALAFVGFIFICTPFISIKVGANSVTQSGFGAMGVLFGGTSAMGVYGVSMTTVMFVGGAYIAYIIGTLLHLANVGLSYKFVKNGEKPLQLGVSAFLITVFGIIALAFGIEAMSDISAHSAASSGYIGSIGLGILAALSGGATLFGYFYSKNTYPRTKVKLKGVKQMMSAVSGILLIICFILFILPAFDLTAKKDRELAVECGESGRATITCDHKFSYDEYGGVTVFKLEGMEEGGEYSFRITLDDDVGADVMEGSVWLCYYDDVSNSSITTILSADVLLENQTATKNSATLTFTNDFGGRDLAVVTGFSANGEGNLYIDYAFFDRTAVLG